MADRRIVQLADVLVNHSVKAKKGEKVLIAGTISAAPLLKELYRKVLQNGAYPIMQITLPEQDKIFYDEADDWQLTYIEDTQMLYHHVDAYIRILSDDNKRNLTAVDPDKISKRQQASQPVSQYLMQGGVRWVLSLFPTNAYAQDADMSLEQYEDFVYGAANIDYSALEQSMLKAADAFNKAKKVRIVGSNGTDLTVDIEGRTAVICHGERNVPDGEFYFTPNHMLTEGTIYYEWPTVYAGREIQGIRLTFKEGKIVEYSAEKGHEFLDKYLNTDEGSRYLGELGIGMNYGIERPTKDILFDEKIGGSVHLAVGRAYERGGKGNESAIHWDMVKNLRDGGEIYLDGVLVQKNGQWLFNE